MKEQWTKMMKKGSPEEFQQQSGSKHGLEPQKNFKYKKFHPPCLVGGRESPTESVSEWAAEEKCFIRASFSIERIFQIISKFILSSFLENVEKCNIPPPQFGGRRSPPQSGSKWDAKKNAS